MPRHAILILFLFGSFWARAADTTFTAKGGKIKATSSTFSLKVGKLKSSSTSSKYGIESINVKIKSKNNSKITISLLAPDGTTTIFLAQKNGGNTSDFDSTFFADSAGTSIQDGKAPFRGYFRPSQCLKTVNSGQTIASTWQLLINDANATDTLVNWSIKFGSNPANGVHLDSSTLPILILNTNKKTIPQDVPNLHVHFYMIDEGLGKWNHVKDSMRHSSYAGLHVHGASSRYAPKQSLAVEMQDAKGNVHDTAMLGMPIEHDWLLVANYFDLTLWHNMLSQHLFREMGHYSPRFRPVEVVINGVYQGVYIFIEKIKQGPDRVNIAKMKLADSTGVAVTGGYIVRTDKTGPYGWTSKYTISGYGQTFLYDFPYPLDTQQKHYIHSYFDSFESALYNVKATNRPGNWRQFGDEKSIMDYMFMQDLSKNGDGYSSSFYMYKDRNSRDRRIHTGPVWDFDIAWNYGWSVDPTGWWHSGFFWWSKLLGENGYGKGDTTFINNRKCNWTIYRRGAFSNKSIDRFLDSSVLSMREGIDRNFCQWPLLEWTYQTGVDTNKYWIHQRLKWFDKNMPGTCRYDIDAPTAKLKGKDTVFLEVNTSYKDSGITYHDNFGDTNVSLVIGSNLDTSQLGHYQISYFLSDKAGNRKTLLREVIVIDTIAPVIALKGSDSVSVHLNDSYTDVGYFVSDNYDLFPRVDTSGTFTGTTNTGIFNITFTARDQSGNKSNVVNRTITVDSFFTSISSLENPGTDFRIYPNPGRGIFHIDASNNYDSRLSLKVFDEMGKEVKGMQLEMINTHSTLLHLENEPAGVYMLKMQTESGASIRQLILRK